MTREQRRDTTFLNSLISYCSVRDTNELRRRIHEAQRNERCIRSALLWVGAAAAAALVAIGYCAVLMPAFFHAERPQLVMLFVALTCGSLFCLGAFLLFWMRSHRVLNRLHEESRRLILHTLECRLGPTHPQRETSFLNLPASGRPVVLKEKGAG